MNAGIEGILEIPDGIVLVEYGARDHPEWAFYEIIRGWKKRGKVPLIIDIWDTLHIFLQNLRFSGAEIDIEDFPVIKERGTVIVGNVLGRIDVVEDFEHHVAVYGKIAKKAPKESRKYTVVLGMEKFPFVFLDDPPKIERYFETVTRRYLSIEGRVNVLFLNRSIASEYLTKGLEQDSDYVIRVSKRKTHLIKHPGEGI